MVGSAVNRAFLPAKSLFEQVGDMMILTARTLVSAVRPPYPYGEEFIGQFLFALQLCWFPLLVSTVAFGFGAPGLQAANFLSLFGALDRLGGFFVLASIREFAPFVTAVVVAGVAGTAITADLGARKIREELDALQVLGVDPIKNLVVPRFLALMLITGLLDIYALVFGISGGILTELLYNQPLGGFFATLFSNASITDLWGSVLKCTLFGAIIAVVCCIQGDDRVRRRRRASAARSTRRWSSPSWASSPSTTPSPRRCWRPTRNCRRSDERLARSPARLARLLRGDRPLRLARRRPRLLAAASCASSARACARPGS